MQSENARTLTPALSHPTRRAVAPSQRVGEGELSTAFEERDGDLPVDWRKFSLSPGERAGVRIPRTISRIEPLNPTFCKSLVINDSILRFMGRGTCGTRARSSLKGNLQIPA